MGKGGLTYSRPAYYSYHSLSRRAAYSFLLVLSVLFAGTVGFHYIENYSYIDAFYFTSMLATAQGPAITPTTVLGKLFASLMAFVSVGSVIFALGFLFGPFFGRLLKMEEVKLKTEERSLSKEIKKFERKL